MGSIGDKEGSASGSAKSSGPGAGPGAGSGGDAADPPPPSDNVIDVAIWPRMIEAGATHLTPSTASELCRRISLDLTGAIPTEAEAKASCEGKTAAEMAEAFFASPGFIAREQKLWMQHLRVDPTKTLADDLVDADGIIASLAKGEIGYDDFAAKILAHPAGAMNRRIDAPHLEDTAIGAFRVFLGRAPLGNEATDLVNLFRVWRRDWDGKYELGYGYYVYFAVLDPGACTTEVYGPAACTSDEIGPTTVMSIPLASPTEYLGLHGSVPADLQLELEKPGRLLAQRDEFWEEAADHALARLLGWWKSSAAEPDTVVPEVRTALAQWFHEQPGHDVRDLYTEIITSLLYTTSAEVAAETEADAPPWTMGPTKAMDSTQFLDSLEKALGRELGFCDIHTDEPIGRNFYFPDRLRQPQPDDFYGFGSDFYLEYGQTLGGCLGGVAEPSQPGMPALFAHIEVADALCGAPSEIAPAGFDTADMSTSNIDALTNFQFQRFLQRAPEPSEKDAVDAATEACLADSACGMDGLEVQLCGALLRSGAFLFY